jgi:hypothetical protein
MRKTLASFTFAAALLAVAATEASAFTFVCQAVGPYSSVGWGRSFWVVDAKLQALGQCQRRGVLCTISYCTPAP